MVSSVTRFPDLGFENLMLPGLKEQRQAALGALREGKSSRQQGGELSLDDQRRADQLKATDRKVRAHEQAHMAVGGELVRGGANFSYETGPDKKRYAVAGDVSIDVSEDRTPEATLAKAEQIQAAALAPMDPSPQDRQVASRASQMALQARQEVAQQAVDARARAGSRQGGLAIGAYQSAGGLELSSGFSALA